MTWLAPWALVGLLALVAPVIVHWLARHQAQRIRFPTIQFLLRTSPVSVRRYRLRDLRLMALRMAILAAAVLALAQPVWVRPGAPAARPARAVVVDTSASLGRSFADGRVGTDVARETAASVSGATNDLRGPAPGEAPNVTIATDRVSDGVARAAAWLARQAPPLELVVVSDFQVGALVESDFDTVPEDAQVRLLPIAVSGPVPAPPAPARGALRVVVGAEQAARAAAAEAAAKEMTPGVFFDEKDTRRHFDLVFPSAANRDQLWQASKPIDSPELFEWVAEIRGQLQRLGQPNELVADYRASASGLGVFTDTDPGSEQAAALMAAILRAAASPSLSAAEREEDTVPAATLEGWQRAGASGAPPVRAGGRSDGRWFWLLALVLFGVETWMRRRPTAAQTEAVHANAA